MAMELVEGCRILVEGKPATYRGLNPKVPGDYWVEFDFGGGWWSYHPSNVTTLEIPMKKPKSNKTFVFDIYKDVTGDWRWKLWAKNGKVVADSAEGYKNRNHALTMVGKIKEGMPSVAVAIEGVVQP
jgi:uncharacterized protein YegP (UPF0339 family)